MSMKPTIVLCSAVILSIAGCGEPSARERSLKRERDSAQHDLDLKSAKFKHDKMFAERFQELMSARESVWYYSNMYIVTPNTLLDDNVQTANRRAIQQRNHEIAKLLLTFTTSVEHNRRLPPNADDWIESLKKLHDLSLAPVNQLDAALARTKEILAAEDANIQGDSAKMQAMTSEEKSAEALHYVSRKDALEGMIKGFEAIKTALPRVVCGTFASDCKDEPK